MRTSLLSLGIDLAAEPKNTGGCLVEWRDGRAVVSWLSTGLLDSDIVEESQRAHVMGIDAPFGWPSFFVEAVAAHHAGKPWPGGYWEPANRQRLRLRATDLHVKATTGISPLSVSSDRIAIPATRCAGLLAHLSVVDRSGDGRVFEVYPAAALYQWGLRHQGYKNGPEALANLVAKLRAVAPWLSLSAADEKTCASCEHAFDALIASLSARAAFKGLSIRPGEQELAAARVEGWIALPAPDSLDALP